MVEYSSFRVELYYRLKVMHIETPSLRDHKNDISSLAKNFLRKDALEYAKTNIELIQKELETLNEYDWPGNV